MSIGKRLHEWRKENRLGTVELSKNTGISTGALSNYENDKREISSNFLLKLKEVYNADIYYILTGVKNTDLKEEEKEVLNAYRNATSAEQEIIKKILDIEIEQEKSSNSMIE